jgi:ribosomal protein S17
MSIEKTEDKSLSPKKNVTRKQKNVIIETKQKFCYPQYGKTIEAKNKKEADKEINKIINK